MEQILEDVQNASSELPLLEHALLELYEKRDGCTLTLEAYREIGGIEGALVKRAESEFERLDAAQKEMLRKFFVLRLIQHGEGSEDTRRRASKEELQAIGGDQKAAEVLLQQWVEARLLTTSRVRGTDLVDVSHEALIRRWERVQTWMIESKETARLMDALRRAATDWNREGRRTDFLFQGIRLAQIEGLLRFHERDLTWLEQKFVEAGVSQRERRRRDKLRLARSALGFTATVLAIVGYLALNWRVSEERWRTQLVRSYWESARSLRDQDRWLRSLHFVAEALMTKPERSSKENLLTGIELHQPRWSLSNIVEHESHVFGMQLDSSGVRLLTWSKDGTARLWNSESGDAIGVAMKHKAAVVGATFDRLESRILTWSTDGTARIWDANSGKPIGAPLRHQDWVNGAMFDRSENRILTWSCDGTAQLWSVESRKHIGSPMKHSGWVMGARIITSKRRILTWSQDGTARLWNAKDGKPVGVPMEHEDHIYGATLDSLETRILTWGQDHTRTAMERRYRYANRYTHEAWPKYLKSNL